MSTFDWDWSRFVINSANLFLKSFAEEPELYKVLFNLINFTIITALLIFAFVLHRKFFKIPYLLSVPSNSILAGYESIGKKDQINFVRKLRKSGNLPPPYPNSWYALLESEKLKTGKVVEITAFGINLVAWRGEGGTAYVSDAYCPHLGAHLGVGGKVEGECIKCPFHGWCFDGSENGKVSKIPYSKSVPESGRLKMWNTLEINDLIFVWYHPENSEPGWSPMQIPELVGKDRWGFRGQIEFDTLCHVQDIPENLSDLAHLNEVHTDLMSIQGNPADSWIGRNFVRHLHHGEWTASEAESHRAKMWMKHDLVLLNKFKLFPANLEAVHDGAAFMLLYMSSGMGKLVAVQSVVPRDVLNTSTILRFYAPNSVSQAYIKFAMDGIMNNGYRDRVIMNRKCYTDQPIFVKEDKFIKSFRRWYSQFY